ncbi:hypothetical protein ACWOA0_04075 [Ignavigranum ruoffiae]|uniref:Uncharacterized protein n=1 Tax=Ignavigranum ruoffiae TaxID=89093 RepID=A0A1H9E2B0_9LACT|nr:hypothetical protein [Ignavigranum ruoffiae]UPQ85305.1 hypothetical protein M0R79_06515 [Ignavigranum ruoffiae]SEQ19850.1 hypothetical protein SAMN04488558_10681 [Ignavigranum ruoffiae]
MINHFVFGEIFLYLVPPLLIYLLQNKFHFVLDYFKTFRINLQILLLPLCLSLIQSFSVLIFTYSLLPLALFLTIFILFIHLYYYIQGIAIFDFKEYFPGAAKLAFLCLSSFLLGLVILRIYTYFIL